ncbi:MAG: ABC transporter ATP-binding protein [Fimbriiglobus sp.]
MEALVEGPRRIIDRMSEPILHVTDVKKDYGSFQALRGVSFDVAASELFGLLGPNGAGKTTLLSILAGLSDATAGSVTLGGQELSTSTTELRRQIGLATQDLAIYPELTAQENLDFFGRLYGLRGPDLRSRVQEMLALAALEDRAKHRAGTFSGGMKRRLNLAVALVHRPKVLLLDEPTTGVDPQSRNHIFEQVKRLNAAGLTVVYTSHYMEEVQALCPRLAIVDHGRIIACDEVQKLLKTMPTTLRLTGANLPTQAPGATAVRHTATGAEYDTDEPGPLLARLAHAQPTAVEVVSPNLEQVFIRLTGAALRD